MLSRLIKALLICSAVVLIGSCGNSPTKDDSLQGNATPSLEDIPRLLSEADAQPEPNKSLSKVNIGSLLLTYGKVDWARNVAADIDESLLTPQGYIDYARLKGGIALRDGEPFVAKRILTSQKVETRLLQVPPENRIGLYDQRAALFYNIAEYRNAVQDRLKIEPIVRDRDFQELNQDLLWQTLMALPREDLELESQMQSNNLAKGWYSLAAVSKNFQNDLQQQLAQIQNWSSRWPNHPASIRLPADLQLLKQLVEKQAKQVAILLPLSGKVKKAAEAIRDGFMASYFVAAKNASRPDVRVYDTTGEDINTLYERAVYNGAEMVVGPLDKDNIRALSLQSELPVPTLALNYIDTPGQTKNLYQFGLAVEDEAIQVADRAWQDGLRRALIIAPKGNWGSRSTITFADKWKELGGSIVGEHRFQGTKDYSNLIKEAMQITKSNQRKVALERRLGRSIEFEPRRRKDIDFIFLVAYPAQARQIKPTLAFHYAGDIPVYATSHIFNGETDSSADRDMNAIRFTTMPWFFNEKLPEKLAIEKYASPNPAYQQLYALGVDVYHLYPRLRQLAEVRQAHFYGSTGALSLNEAQRVVREQAWAQFVGGQAYTMPTISTEEDDS